MRAASGALLMGLTMATARASGEELVDAFDRVYRAVVVVRTTERDTSSRADGGAVSVAGVGSGVLISADGRVLTAAHLVDVASGLRVEFSGGEHVDTRVVASEPEADVALLQLARVPTSQTAAAR